MNMHKNSMAAVSKITSGVTQGKLSPASTYFLDIESRSFRRARVCYQPAVKASCPEFLGLASSMRVMKTWQCDRHRSFSA